MPVRENTRKEELMNKGWHQMQATLDREMPQKRKRIGIWMFFGVTAVLIMSLGFIYLPTDDVTTTQASALNPQAVKVQAESESTIKVVQETSVQASVKNNEEQEQTRSGESVVSATHSETIVGLSTSSSLQKRKDQSGNGIIEKEGVVIATTPHIQSQPILPPTELKEKDQTVTQEETALIEGVELHNEARAIAQYGTVNTLPPENIDYTSKEGMIIPAASQMKPRFGSDIFMASHFVTPFSMRGVEVGALATVSISRKWKFSTGLSYGHYENDGILNFGASDDLSDQEVLSIPIDPGSVIFGNPNVDPSTVYGKIGYDTAQILTNKFNYLHMPISASYRIGRFFHITGGLKLSYLLKAPSGGSLNAVTNFGGTQNVSFDLMQTSNFLIQEKIVKRWDVAPLIGIGFKFARRFAVDIQYQHGLIPYLDRQTPNERSDYNRSMSVGLSYSIF